MSWFEEQIKQRKLNDDELLAACYQNIAHAVIGGRVSQLLDDESEQAKDALKHILKYYHVKMQDMPDGIKSFTDQMEYVLRPHGIMRRPVKLTGTWYEDAVGAMLGTLAEDGTVVALLPDGFSGYCYYDAKLGKRVKINKKNISLIDEEAIVFYKPFPQRSISLVDLALYAKDAVNLKDVVVYAVLMAIVTGIGMILPMINKFLFGRVVEQESTRLLFCAAAALICTSISKQMIGAMSTLVVSRISTRLDTSVEAATMMRVLSLPASFFKKYSAGELSAHTQYMNSLCNVIADSLFTTGIASVLSLVYITQIFTISSEMVVPSLLIIIVTVVFSLISSFVQMKISKQTMELSSKESGLSFALINGIQKIKLTGAEKRAFAKWANLYAKQAELEYNPPMFIKLNSVITTAINVIGAVVLYAFAAKANLSVADYYAFNVSYGMVSGAFSSLAGIALTVANIKPILDMAKPLMDAEPEISENKHMVTRLSGNIELAHVSFKYEESSPLILDDISLKIKAGQYVAIVGKTGCGKSTLMRILLGFEKIQTGAVYYDGKEINTLDLKSLRRRIGVVMQTGKLFAGSLYENIVISAPELTLKDAWDAAKKAGIAGEIQEMPMGMNTLVAEGTGGISGGQKQRVMIARAIAPKPKILMFDEATSALDNITQKIVSDSLDSLKCTRIVIAHRLSTIKQCDRIIVLDKGKIIEDGSYEELIAHNGFFAELVERQRVDVV